MRVPFLDLRIQHRSLRRELLSAWERALDESTFIGGSSVEEFEKAFARFCEAKHAVGVGNGTDALILALKALQVGEGDEIILPANSFVATAEAVVHAGAIPVFADIDPDTYDIDADSLRSRITRRTKAIIAVHLYGQPADMEPILDIAGGLGLPVIEDAAQAHGSRYHSRRAGSLGTVACFSFYPGKNLGACGDGGAVVTNDARIAETVRKLKDHGGLRKYEHDVVGLNSRLDSLQAAVLHIKLPELEARNEMRRQIAGWYNDLLSDLDGIITPVEAYGAESVYHLYVIRIENGRRDSLQAYLSDRGIQTAIHYPAPIHCTRAFARFRRTECTVAEGHARRILSLPMYPEITRDQLQYVASAIRDGMSAVAERASSTTGSELSSLSLEE
jgi:dTDP-4-amino-4,6-dideoxygalactose transaminase